MGKSQWESYMAHYPNPPNPQPPPPQPKPRFVQWVPHKWRDTLRVSFGCVLTWNAPSGDPRTNERPCRRSPRWGHVHVHDSLKKEEEKRKLGKWKGEVRGEGVVVTHLHTSYLIKKTSRQIEILQFAVSEYFRTMALHNTVYTHSHIKVILSMEF